MGSFDQETVQTPPHISSARRWAALWVILFGQLVVSMDMTVLNIALPHLSAEVEPTSDQQLWIVDIYSLILAGLLVPASAMSDRIGRKRMFVAGCVLFGLASLLIFFAHSALLIIAVRAILGMGGAMIMPTTISMIRSIFTNASERAVALAFWSAMASAGTVVGPLVGGFLMMHFSWHAAFLVNVPLMAIVVIAAVPILPEVRVKNAGRWDVLGAALALGGMMLFMWGIKHLAAVAPAYDLAGAVSLVAGIVLVLWFARRCLRRPEPLIDLKLFSQRPFAGGVITALCCMFGLSAQLFLVSQWLQLVNGNDPLQAGLLLIPSGVASVVAGMIAPSLAIKAGAKPVMLGGVFLVFLGMLAPLVFSADLNLWVMLVATVLAGLGTGALAVGTAVIMGATPREKASSGAACEEVAYDLGNVLGVAVLGSVASIAYGLGFNTDALLAAGLDAGSVEAATQSLAAAAQIAHETGVTELLTEGVVAFDNGFVIASAVGALILLLALLVIARFIPRGLQITDEE